MLESKLFLRNFVLALYVRKVELGLVVNTEQSGKPEDLIKDDQLPRYVLQARGLGLLLAYLKL